MKHFVAYHKVAEWGKFDEGGDWFEYFSRHPKTKLDNSLNQKVWLISGERIKGKMEYKLCACYVPTEIEPTEDDDGYWVSGKGRGLQPHLEISQYPWFDLLRKEQGNFGFGLNEIQNEVVIQNIKSLVPPNFLDELLPPNLENSVAFRLPDEVLAEEKYIEGAVKKIRVVAYERDKKARQACIEHYGAICCVCGLDFETQYGEIGKGYIHVHHLIPLSRIKQEYKVDPIKDLRPVCPNCHAMIHKMEPELHNLAKLRTLVKHKFSDYTCS